MGTLTWTRLLRRPSAVVLIASSSPTASGVFSLIKTLPIKTIECPCSVTFFLIDPFLIFFMDMPMLSLVTVPSLGTRLWEAWT